MSKKEKLLAGLAYYFYVRVFANRISIKFTPAIHPEAPKNRVRSILKEGEWGGG